MGKYLKYLEYRRRREYHYLGKYLKGGHQYLGK